MKIIYSLILLCVLQINRSNADFFPVPDNFGCPKAYSYYFYDRAVRNVTNQYRNYDGSYNNLAHPMWGRTNNTLKRLQPTAFSDFKNFPSGQKRPLARVISNQICAAQKDNQQLDPKRLSGLFLVWGQFISHDLHHTPTQVGPKAEHFDIQIPRSDPNFDPEGKGNITMQFIRSVYQQNQSQQMPRQQLNLLNSWFDAQFLYGNDDLTARSLRTYQKGKLKLDDQGLLTKKGIAFVSGDKRVNENIVLTAINTLFVREHNRICETMSRIFGHLSDEQLYIYGKNYVAALVAKITYDDYLPLLLGPSHNLKPYAGYEKDVQPSITNIFSTSAFRFGHFTVPSHMLKMDNQGNVIQKIKVSDGVQNPSLIKKGQDIGLLLKGQSMNIIKKRSSRVVDELRNLLAFSPTNRTFLIDLAASNIQRGRDHGLPDYNTFRKHFGLPIYKQFSQFTKDQKVAKKLQQCFKNINLVDAFVGMMVEDDLIGASVGPLGAAVLCQTLWRVRAGDRFWYEYAMPEQIVRQIKATTLADIITRNTQIKNISSNVFVVPESFR